MLTINARRVTVHIAEEDRISYLCKRVSISRAISQGPKKSRFLGPKALPLVLVIEAARIKSITHGAV